MQILWTEKQKQGYVRARETGISSTSLRNRGDRVQGRWGEQQSNVNRHPKYPPHIGHLLLLIITGWVEEVGNLSIDIKIVSVS